MFACSPYTQVLYTLKQAIVDSETSLPSVSKLRKKHSLTGFKPTRTISCPAPSQGGGLYTNNQLSPSSPTGGVTIKMVAASTSPGGHIQFESTVGVTARAVCPQTGILGSVFASAYAADVPTEVLQYCPVVELEKNKELLQHGRRFTLSSQTRDH